MSETPRTEGATWFTKTPGNPVGADVVHQSFARALERELNAANERIAKMEAALHDCDRAFNRHGPDEGSTFGQAWASVRCALGKQNPWEPFA